MKKCQPNEVRPNAKLIYGNSVAKLKLGFLKNGTVILGKSGTKKGKNDTKS